MISRKYIAAALFAGMAIGALLYAQNPPAPVPATGGRGGRGGRGRAGRAGAAAAGPRTTGFPQYTRPLASQDVLFRGKALYTSNCASCHSDDLRGVIGKGSSLIRSGVALQDQKGELITAELAKHDPKINLVGADSDAIAEYIHSVLATMGPQGSPPGRNPVGIQLNLLVGDAKAGEAYFNKECAGCHSVTGDMKGIATKYGDVRALQNGWVSGAAPSAGGGGRGRGRGGRGGGGRGGTATVTMPNGTKIEGRVVRKDDYIVVLAMDDGSRMSIPLDAPGPKPQVEVKDPQEAHKKMALTMDDPENKNMHDVTAFLWTLK